VRRLVAAFGSDGRGVVNFGTKGQDFGPSAKESHASSLQRVMPDDRLSTVALIQKL